MRVPRGVAAMPALVVTGTFVALTGTTVVAPRASAEDEQVTVCDPAVLADAERGTPLELGETDPVRTPHGRMHVAQAHRLTRGAGQTVAVVDSGVGPVVGTPVRSETVPGISGPPASGHGTLVAGLVAGEFGVAPEAAILSMRVYDTPVPDREQGHRGVDSAGIAAGLERLAALHPTVGFGVVNVSLSVPAPDPRLEAAVRALLDRDVVVVASSGNSRASVDPGDPGTRDSDVEAYPADYEGVVGVTAVGPDAEVDLRPYVAPNADTDVAAPTVGARTVNLNGQPCVISDEIATSYAAAQVSGVVALLRAHRPQETGPQAVARLLRAAEGSEDGRHPWLGAGVVQAADALTQELSPLPDGTLKRSREIVSSDAEAPLPPERVDLFAPSRALLLWTGLAAAAVLGLALLLRPLSRARR